MHTSKDSILNGELFHFYVSHLKSTLLPFWLRSSIDWDEGGFFNCYDNTGTQLVSEDKYTWSQGRFVWMYAKLSSIEADIFTDEERAYFLKLAEHGATFLRKYCLMEDGQCAFVMDRYGNHKLQPGSEHVDSSIFADCFVIEGLAKFAVVAKHDESLQFAKDLYKSVHARLSEGSYRMDPYPTPEGYKSHNIPMIMLNVTRELLEAVEGLGEEGGAYLRDQLNTYLTELTSNFIGQDGILNEMILQSNEQTNNLLGRYCNPGHTLEDVWFMILAAQTLKREELLPKIMIAGEKALEIGWDDQYGGLLLFVDREGGKPTGSIDGIEHVNMVGQIQQNWDNKLWWPHSEALYTTLLCYTLSDDESYLSAYQRIHEYTFSTFPNPNKEIGEWIQIRSRDGSPIEKVVALPVKDPYHIIRNVCSIIELLHSLKE